jgi:hypothetical protein
MRLKRKHDDATKLIILFGDGDGDTTSSTGKSETKNE